MQISDVRVRLVKDSKERLKAVCSVTLDGQFVVRDVKIVEGTNGLFVAMPSRKLSVPCPKCRTQNHLRARYCNECGAQLPSVRVPSDANGREKAHRDIAHPINASFRQAVQGRVLEAYRAECEVAEDSGYAPIAADADSGTAGAEAGGYDTFVEDRETGGERGEPRGGDQAAAGDRGAPAEGRSGWRRQRGRRRGRSRRPEPESRPAAQETAVSTPPGSDSAVLEGGEAASAEPDIGRGGLAGWVGPEAPVDEPTTEEPAGPSPADREQAPADQVEMDEAATEPTGADDRSDDSTPFGAGVI